MSSLYIIIGFVLTISVLVFVHELGHFTFAKAFGVKVEKFSIGFGRSIFSRIRNGTEYRIGFLPFGGYVKIDEETLLNSRYIHKVLIIVGGSMFGIVFALLIIASAMNIGIERKMTVVGCIVNNSISEKYGIRQGDQIISINKDGIKNWNDVMYDLYMSKEKEFNRFVITRNGSMTNINIPIFSKNDIAKVGIYPIFDKNAPKETEKYGIMESFYVATDNIYKMTRMNASILSDMITGKISMGMLQGPIGIFRSTGNMLKGRFTNYLEFLGILSFSLSFMNLIPIPALDGGSFLLVSIEKIFRKRFSKELHELIGKIGIIFIAVLVIHVTVNDVERIIHGERSISKDNCQKLIMKNR